MLRSHGVARYLTRSLTTVTKTSEKPLGQAFYDDKILTYANKPVQPVSLHQLIRFGQTPSSNQSAQYARTELPVRLARRVRAFQTLPFIVGTNPYIREIYRLYYDSFESLEPFVQMKQFDPVTYADKLKDLVERHTDNIPTLARGFLECKQYMDPHDMAIFLDEVIKARIGIRLIAEQCIVLTEQDQPQQQPRHFGIIDTKLQPSQLVQHCAEFVAELCDFNYGVSPETIVNGHVDTSFTYVPVHLEYILTELLKNSHRATVEHSRKQQLVDVPPIEVTISHSQEEIGIRIRDQGGGINEDSLAKVFDYSYTTVKKPGEDDDQLSIFNGMAQMAMQSGVGGPLAGLGYGLPLARMYAQYFGGSLTLVSMNGYGCDTFLKLKHIDQSLAEGLEI
ncbi:alpha-ketoacid dehydrogenase kinase [Hesseltinella vesiculosa]|uniref:Protein-serine/threonine kinase n=1 Tax=Hesseltinella vesiculosa TaxID=101127 RepID=A0A1X2GRH8_9FUNG|nr:alpha-ketoacid dehydrogenase kinase [Hesseltinella vesiculosa]